MSILAVNNLIRHTSFIGGWDLHRRYNTTPTANDISKHTNRVASIPATIPRLHDRVSSVPAITNNVKRNVLKIAAKLKTLTSVGTKIHGL